MTEFVCYKSLMGHFWFVFISMRYIEDFQPRTRGYNVSWVAKGEVDTRMQAVQHTQTHTNTHCRAPQ